MRWQDATKAEQAPPLQTRTRKPKKPNGDGAERQRLLFFFLFAHLHGEVALVAEFFDLVHLGFEPVDVIFFIVEQDLEEIARAVVFIFDGDADGVVVHLGGIDLEIEVALDHILDGFTDRELEGLHVGDAIEEEDAFHKAFGVFHFADRLHLDVLGEAFVAPVFAHFGVEEILVDRGEFFAKGFVELFEYGRVTLHAEKDEGNETGCKERKMEFAGKCGADSRI